MTCKFIELHDRDNEPILINPSWIACIEKNGDEGCSVRLGISSDGGTAYIRNDGMCNPGIMTAYAASDGDREMKQRTTNMLNLLGY